MAGQTWGHGELGWVNRYQQNTALLDTVMIQRTTLERFLSWPWRPWVKFKRVSRPIRFRRFCSINTEVDS